MNRIRKSDKKFENKIYTIEILLFTTILLILGLYNIQNYYGMVNGVDELGYLGCAYYLAGKGLIGMTSTLSYYSFGYSFFLTPIVFLLDNPIYIFRAIIVLHVFFQIVAFYVSIQVCEKIFQNISKNELVIVCFLASLYVSNYTDSKYIFSEMLVKMLFWLIIFYFLLILEKFTFFRMMILEILCVYIYFTHQRTLAVVVSMAIVYMLMLLKGDIPKKSLKTLIIPVLLILGGKYIKMHLMSTVYAGSVRLAVNDYSAQVSKIKTLMTIDGITNFITGFFAKLYYFNFSTLFLGGIALVVMIFSLKKIIGTINKKSYLYIFLLFSWIFAMGIQTIFLIYPSRYDLVIYGRYIEYVYGPFIIIGFVTLKEKRNISKGIFIQYIFTLIGMSSAFYLFEKYNLKLGESYLSPATYGFISSTQNLQSGILITLLVSGVFSVLYLIYLKIYNDKIIWGLIIIGYIFINIFSLRFVEKSIIDDQKQLYINYSEMAEYINSYGDNVYYCDDERDIYMRLRQIQFLCIGKEIKRIEIENIINENQFLLITFRDIPAELQETLKKSNAKVVCENYMYYIWECN